MATYVSLGQPWLSVVRASSVINSHFDIQRTLRLGQSVLSEATVASVTFYAHREKT